MVAAHRGSTETLAEPPIFRPALRAAWLLPRSRCSPFWRWAGCGNGARSKEGGWQEAAQAPACRRRRCDWPAWETRCGIRLAGNSARRHGGGPGRPSGRWRIRVPHRAGADRDQPGFGWTEPPPDTGCLHGWRRTLYGFGAVRDVWDHGRGNGVGPRQNGSESASIARPTRLLVLRLAAGGLPLRGRVFDDGGGAIPGAVVSIARASAFAGINSRAPTAPSAKRTAASPSRSTGAATPINIQAGGYACDWQDFLLAGHAERIFRMHPGGRLRRIHHRDRQWGEDGGVHRVLDPGRRAFDHAAAGRGRTTRDSSPSMGCPPVATASTPAGKTWSD